MNNLPTIILERQLHFYFGDLNHDNFIFTDSGDLYFADFNMAGFLPLIFMPFVLTERWPVGFWIKDRLSLPDNSIEAMKRAYYFFQIGVHDLGKSLQREKYTVRRVTDRV